MSGSDRITGITCYDLILSARVARVIKSLEERFGVLYMKVAKNTHISVSQIATCDGVLRKEESGPVAAKMAKNSAVGMRILVERFDVGRRLIVETTVKCIIHFARPFILEVGKDEKII